MTDPIELLIQGRAHELGRASRSAACCRGKRPWSGRSSSSITSGRSICPGRPRHRRAAAPAYRARHRHLSVCRRNHAPRQPARAGDPPGEINWMTAGSGIAHSERTEPAMKRTGFRMHGVQSWVALPRAHEETAPSFEHVEMAKLPAWQDGGAALRLIVGTYGGRTAPTTHFSPIFYVAVEMPAAAKIAVSPEHVERAAYVAEGSVTIGDRLLAVGDLAAFHAGQPVEAIAGPDGAKVMLLGGATMDGPREARSVLHPNG